MRLTEEGIATSFSKFFTEEELAALAELFGAKQGDLILISSEIKELLKCANRIVTVYSGRVNGELAVGDETRQADVMAGIIGFGDGAAEKRVRA